MNVQIFFRDDGIPWHPGTIHRQARQAERDDSDPVNGEKSAKSTRSVSGCFSFALGMSHV